jgi:thiamine-phosphate pyrophosphorylase
LRLRPYPLPTRGLYAITGGAGTDPEERLAAAIAGGARCVQYRVKSLASEERRRQASALIRICHRHAVPFIVNDDPELARQVGADGVHLGRFDPPYALARRLLGPGSVIGVSCYDDVDRACQAAAAGADYVAFGSFFPSATKPDAARAGLSLLRQARPLLALPIVAIGGITPENGAALIGAGADLLAVIGGVFGGPDPEGAARRYARLWDPPHPQTHPMREAHVTL